MRAVVQRVSRAAVRVDGATVGEIKRGLLVLLGVEKEDAEADSQYIADKTATLRIFPDDEGRMNRSVEEIGGSVLVVSQFTLCGDVRKGRRPGFASAADPETGRKLYLQCVELLRSKGLAVATGQFQADMQVELVNDGPVTILLDSTKAF